MWCTFYPHHRSSVTVHVGVCGGGVEQGLMFDFNSSTEYNLYVYLTYIWFFLFDIYNEQGTWTSNTRRQASSGSCCILVVLASWFVLFLSLYLSFVSALFLFICFPLLMLLFFVGLGLKEDSPSSNMLRFLQKIPRCSSFFGCCSSLGFGNEVNSQFLSNCHQYSTDLPNHQQIGLFTHHWPVNQWRTETSIRSGHLDAHALMSTNSVWTCTSIAPAWTSCPTWTFCPLGQTGGPPVFPAPPQCSPGHLGVVINIVIIIILIAIISFINLCRWTAGFLVWTSMLGTMVVLTYVTK